MDEAAQHPDGLRERKRRETFRRIAETGLRMFVDNGYDATTLDAIAAASGISRRTFFYYFKSKEDVLLAHEGGGFAEALRPAILAQSADLCPLDAVRNCLLDLASKYETRESIVTDGLLRSTPALRARKEALFVEVEAVMVDALREVWPDAAQRDTLRMVAMVSMGTLRLAIENWREARAVRPLAYFIDEGFTTLKDNIPPR